jgi:hypothetical protein
LCRVPQSLDPSSGLAVLEPGSLTPQMGTLEPEHCLPISKFSIQFESLMLEQSRN